MLKTIIIKELQNHLYSLRFFLSLVIILVVFIVGTFGFIKSYESSKTQNFEFEKNKVKQVRRLASNSATELATNRQSFQFSPSQNGIISDNHEHILPNKINYSAYNVFGFEVAKGSVNPLLKLSQKLNWSFIVTVILSFIALLFAFDAVSGEKEERTMALAFSNSISRGVVLFGKYISIILILMIAEILGIIISILMLILWGQAQINVSFLIEIGGFLTLSLLFLSLFTAFGMLASVASKKSNISLLVSLSIWLLFVVIIPNTAVFWANKLFPIESSDVVQTRISERRGELSRNAPPGSWSSSGGNPFFPKHELRANLQMAMFLNEKEHKDAYYSAMMEQFENTRYFTLLSPVALFDYSNEAFLGGGYIRFKKNWEDLHIHQEQFLTFFKELDAKDEESPHWYNPNERYSTTKKPVEFDLVPIYKEKLPNYTQRFDFMKYYLMIMIIYTGIAFFASFVLFARYDVR